VEKSKTYKEVLLEEHSGCEWECSRESLVSSSWLNQHIKMGNLQTLAELRHNHIAKVLSRILVAAGEDNRISQCSGSARIGPWRLLTHSKEGNCTYGVDVVAASVRAESFDRVKLS
jgi:hypothetical protein